MVPKSHSCRWPSRVHRRVHRCGHRAAGDHRRPEVPGKRGRGGFRHPVGEIPLWVRRLRPARGRLLFPVRQHRPRHLPGDRPGGGGGGDPGLPGRAHRAHQPGGAGRLPLQRHRPVRPAPGGVLHPHGQRLVLHRHPALQHHFGAVLRVRRGVRAADSGLFGRAGGHGLAGPAAGRPGAQDQRDRAGAGQLLLRPVPGGLRGRDLRDDQGLRLRAGPHPAPGGLRQPAQDRQ